MAGLESVALAHVEQYERGIAGVEPPAHFVHRHERHAAGGVGNELLDRLAAAEVGAQRLGQVGRHLQVERAHLLDELGSPGLLQARVGADLLGERGMAAPLVVMRGEDGELGRQLEQRG